MKLAMTYLLTLNRIPLIYSGDEVAASYRDVGALFTPAAAIFTIFEIYEGFDRTPQK